MNIIQFAALKRIYDRAPILSEATEPSDALFVRMTFDEFRRKAYSSHMNCVMVPWKGMWLGIEPDGYIHS